MENRETYVGSLRHKAVKVEVVKKDGVPVKGKMSGPMKNYSKPVRETTDGKE